MHSFLLSCHHNLVLPGALRGHADLSSGPGRQLLGEAVLWSTDEGVVLVGDDESLKGLLCLCVEIIVQKWIDFFKHNKNYILYTVRAEIFAVVLFSRILRVKPSRKFPLQFMSIYSNDNISKIAKLTTRELPHLAKTEKITVHENNGVYST